MFSDQQRYQNPGLAKNYDYDTIIIGSSMTENFLPSYVNEKLGVRTLKLSISGAVAKEQYMIAKLAIETGKVKNVIWGLDYFSLRGEPDRVREDQGPFPFYLYDQNPFNDMKYLINLDTTKDSYKILAAQIGLIGSKNIELDFLNTWFDIYPFSKAVVLKEWEKLKQGGPVIPSEYEWARIEKNLNENVFPVIMNNRNINFYIYYPPYSILQHRFFYIKSKVLFYNELKTKKYIFKKIGSLDNVKVYDFQHLKEITFNLDNYKDLAHHSPRINEYIIDAISQEKYRVNEENINGVLEELKNQVETKATKGIFRE